MWVHLPPAGRLKPRLRRHEARLGGLNGVMRFRAAYTELYVHLVWGTWDRLPLLVPGLREQVYACIAAECRSCGADVLALGGVEDHVHLLVRLPTTISIADLVQCVKGASSHLSTHQLAPGSFFKWQGGYAAFTVSKSVVPRVRNYIAHQAEHHHTGSLHREAELPELAQP